MKVYTSPGRALLTCSGRRLEAHLEGKGQHDPDGHTEVLFVWQAGSEHANHHQSELTCTCGQRLVHSRGDDPWAADYDEVEGEPHHL